MNNVSLNVWVVDDDEMYLEMTLAYVRLLGHNARGFFSGERCLSDMGERPDVIILDHNLGDGMNGTDVLRELRHEKHKPSVIYVSGDESPSTVSGAFKNGSEDFFAKDSASLLRLKLKLDELRTRKSARLKSAKLRKRVWKTAGFLIVLSALLTAAYYLAS